MAHGTKLNAAQLRRFKYELASVEGDISIERAAKTYGHIPELIEQRDRLAKMIETKTYIA